LRILVPANLQGGLVLTPVRVVSVWRPNLGQEIRCNLKQRTLMTNPVGIRREGISGWGHALSGESDMSG